MHPSLLDTISGTAPLTDADIHLCDSLFEPLKAAKDLILEKQDTVPQYLYFIVSGFVRLSYYDEQGLEVTSHISSPNSFITPFLSFIHQKKAKEQVQCVTTGELLRISRKELVALIESSENFKKFSLVIFEQAIAKAELRANDLATLSAEQRYRKLLETQPEILRHVPVGYIASYLGIKSQSLSRIRRNITL